MFFKSHSFSQYTHAAQLQPLLPAARRLAPLLEQAHDLVRRADRLSGLCQPGALGGLRGLLRAMNAYYTQKFEGLEKMQPLEIEQALRGEQAADPEKAGRQRLALAHMATEAQLEVLGPQWDAKTVWSPQMVCDIHQDVFARLPEADRAGKGGATLRPGALQTGPAKVRALLEQWGNGYGGVHGGGMPVLAMAASHQRLRGIQPFREGSGRVACLHTHLVLGHLGLTNGLWSPLRGFARSQDAYRAHLAAAHDLRGLEEWMHYVLAQCLEQVQLMTGLLAPQDMQDRIAACLGFEAHVVRQGVRTESLRALHYLFATQGMLDRRDFKAMLGLGDRMATAQITALLQRGLLETDSPHGKLRFGVPQHALRFYFPRLWPEAEREA